MPQLCGQRERPRGAKGKSGRGHVDGLPHFVTQPRNSRQFFMANKFCFCFSRRATNRNRAVAKPEAEADAETEAEGLSAEKEMKKYLIFHKSGVKGNLQSETKASGIRQTNGN